MADNDLISRSALIAEHCDGCDAIANGLCDHDVCGAAQLIMEAPAVDAVYRGVFEQVLLERNTAFEQLEEHGIPFGGVAPDVVKVVRCKDCKHFYDTHINPAHSCKRGGTQVWDVSFTPDDFCSYGERRDNDGK